LRDRGFLPNHDLDIAIQSIEKTQQALDGKTVQVVVDQGGNLWLVDAVALQQIVW